MQPFAKEKIQTRMNYRPIVFAACSAAFGAAIAVPFNGLCKWWVCVPLWLVFTITAIFLSKRKVRAVITAVCCLTIGLLVFGLAAEKSNSYDDAKIKEGNYTVYGTVQSKTHDKLILHDVSICDYYGEVYKGWQLVVYTGESTVEIGDRVRFYEMVKNASTVYQKRQGIRYVSTASVTVVGCSKNPFVKLNRKLVSTLKQGLGNRVGGIASALLVGASSEADDSDLDAFRRGGVAHIFAVSGLHVAFLAGAILGLFRLLLIPKKLSAVITVLVLFLYSALCCFTPSSLRAAIMCSVGLLASVSGRQYDGLNSLSLSVILLLLIDGRFIGNIGFQLSVTAVLSLSLYARRFACVLFDGVCKLLRLKGNEYTRSKLFAFTSTVSTLFVVQLWSLPIVLKAFGYLAVFGIFFNALLVPLVGIAFPLLIITAFLSLLGSASVLLYPAGILLRFSVGLTTMANADVLAFSMPTAVVVTYYLLLFVLSGRLGLYRGEKCALSVGIALFLVLCIVLMAINI